MDFEDADLRAEREGHTRKFHWRKRTIYHEGPPQQRKVVLVVQKPVYDEKWSVSIPRRYQYRWYLECGHSQLPARRYDAQGWKEYPEGYFDPEEYIAYCGPCQRALDTRTEERYKEWYWDDHHRCSTIRCPECQCCLECKGHTTKCSVPSRDYLMEMIFLSSSTQITDELRDNVSAIVDLLPKKLLGEALQAYAEDEGY